MKKVFVVISILVAMGYATPSTQIWNPSTDIQPAGVWHLGIDNYFTSEGLDQGGYALPTDVGLTYGLGGNFELGIDNMQPQRYPLSANFKYGLSEGVLPFAFAVGGFGFGTKKDETDLNVGYGVISKMFGLGRISLGYFSGSAKLLVNQNGDQDNQGSIITWDKQITDKLWLCVDYAGSKSALGALFYGFSWAFSSNTSVIFAYGKYNNTDIKPTYTTQLDINI